MGTADSGSKSVPQLRRSTNRFRATWCTPLYPSCQDPFVRARSKTRSPMAQDAFRRIKNLHAWPAGREHRARPWLRALRSCTISPSPRRRLRQQVDNFVRARSPRRRFHVRRGDQDASDRLLPPHHSTTSTRASWVPAGSPRLSPDRLARKRALHDARIASTGRAGDIQRRFLPLALQHDVSLTPLSPPVRTLTWTFFWSSSRPTGRRALFHVASVKRRRFQEPRCLPFDRIPSARPLRRR